MVSIDAIRQKARTALHHAMERPAFYYDPKTLLPYPVTIRVHIKQEAKGDVQGTSFRYAERREESPKVIFLREELVALGVTPARLGVVMLSAEEGYRLDNDEPKYFQTKTWFVAPLSDGELTEYRSPQDGIVGIGRVDLPTLDPEPMDNALLPPSVSGLAILFYILSGDIDLPTVG